MPDALDYRIVHALQAAPRAPWGAVGEVAGMSAATAARRWERLVGGGLAWIVTYPGAAFLGRRCCAFVEVQVAAGRDDVVDALLLDGDVATVQRTTGDFDLLLTMMMRDLDTLGDWVQRLAARPGVARTRTRIVMRVFGESERWRVGALDDDEESALADFRPDDRPLVHEPDEPELRLIEALAADGRRSAVDLASDAGMSAQTVRRRLAALIAERVLSVRCEVAHVLSGWPVTATVWARASSRSLDLLPEVLESFSEVRVCCEVTGTANVVLTVWLQHVSELSTFEHELERRVPGLVVFERSITLETPKRLGTLLDRAGTRVGTVPLSLLSATSDGDA